MSLYRQTGRTPWSRVAIALVAALVLVGIGFGIGRATAPSTTLQDNLSELRSKASVITDALELVPLHYESSSETTRQGARDQLARAREQFADLEPQLGLLDAARTAAAAKALETVERLARENAPPAEVEAAARQAGAAVNAAVGSG
jgi:hypothetical protein